MTTQHEIRALLEHHYWMTASAVCTDRELVVLRLRNSRHLGTRTIATALGIDRRQVRDHLDNADRKITAALNP